MDIKKMNITKKVLKIIEQDVGSFIARPTFEWKPEGVLFRFSDARTMREVEGYIQNMRGGIECKPWFPDENLGNVDPFAGDHMLMVTWKHEPGESGQNSKKAVQFVIAKWRMEPAEGSSTDKGTDLNAFNF
jgi:hypothetical protein